MDKSRTFLALIVGFLTSVVTITGPALAQRTPSVNVKAHERLQPDNADVCCTIVALDNSSGIVTARYTTTRETFQFQVKDRTLMQTLSPGQAVWVDDAAEKAGVHPADPCCNILHRPAIPGTNVREQRVGDTEGPNAAERTKARQTAARRTGATETWFYRRLTAFDPDLAHRLVPCCVVANVNASAGMLVARDTQNGQTFNLTLGSNPKQFNIDQVVYMDMGRKNAAVTGFPIEVSRRDKIGRSSRKMETTVKLSSTGRLDAVTRIWTAEAVLGFTGGVVVFVMDLDGNDYWASELHKWGVDGEAMPGASDITRSWTETVPADVLKEAAELAIVHQYTPTVRWRKFLKDTKEGMTLVRDIAVMVAEIYALTQGAPPGAGGGE
jgi:hypothetical protein